LTTSVSSSVTTLPGSPASSGSSSAGAGSGGASKDPCSIVTTDDVVAAFGGTVAAGVANSDNGGCDYDISGTTKTGPVGIFAQISIGYGRSDYISATEEKQVFPELVEVPGVGDAAWCLAFGHQLHVSFKGTELLISGSLPGDATAIQAEIVGFAKVVTSKL
jgi:hypothetical protein